jgi:hypothetical protein
VRKIEASSLSEEADLPLHCFALGDDEVFLNLDPQHMPIYLNSVFYAIVVTTGISISDDIEPGMPDLNAKFLFLSCFSEQISRELADFYQFDRFHGKIICEIGDLKFLV